MVSLQPVCCHLGQLSLQSGVSVRPATTTVVRYSTSGREKCRETIAILCRFPTMVPCSITGVHLYRTDRSLPFASFFSVSMAILRRRLHDGGFTDPIDGQEPVAPRWYKWLDDVATIDITPETKFAGKQRNLVKNKDTRSVCNCFVTIVITDMEIPTMDSVRSATLIGYLLINNSNPLCVGPTGSGKTLTVTAKLSRNMPKKFICDFITFSARTSANQTQVWDRSYLPTRDVVKNTRGTKTGKREIAGFFCSKFEMAN